jgi:RNA polymerase II subunit A small phosphatase-like protein
MSMPGLKGARGPFLSFFLRWFKPEMENCLEKMSLLLDLDETLIHSLDRSEIKKVPMEYQKKFKRADMKGYYRVFQRPYLQTFLDYAFANFNVSIFTAADKDYALFIVKNFILIKPERKLQYMFYRYTSTLSENYYSSPKDLRILWDVLKVKGITKCSAVIVDDLAEVADANPENVIRAPSFNILKGDKMNRNAAHDTFLLNAIPSLENKKREFMTHCCPCLKGGRCIGYRALRAL